MVENQEILAVAKNTKGAIGLASKQLGMSVSELKKIIKNNCQIADTFREEKENFEAVINDYKDFQKKLAIIKGDVSAVNEDNQASFYVKKVTRIVESFKAQVNKIDSEDYHPDYNDIAYQVLAASPFTTKSHLCSVFYTSESMIDLWINDHQSFSDSVAKGQAEGEVKARNLLLLASLQPQNKVNTQLLKVLANNVYDIKDESQSIIVNNQNSNHIEYTDPRDEQII